MVNWQCVHMPLAVETEKFVFAFSMGSMCLHLRHVVVSPTVENLPLTFRLPGPSKDFQVGRVTSEVSRQGQPFNIISKGATTPLYFSYVKGPNSPEKLDLEIPGNEKLCSLQVQKLGI